VSNERVAFVEKRSQVRDPVVGGDSGSLRGGIGPVEIALLSYHG